MEQETKNVDIVLPEASQIDSSKIRLSNKVSRDTLFVSLYPKKRTEKP